MCQNVVEQAKSRIRQWVACYEYPSASVTGSVPTPFPIGNPRRSSPPRHELGLVALVEEDHAVQFLAPHRRPWRRQASVLPKPHSGTRCDVDGSAPLYEFPEFKGQVAGAGETAWVRDGKIVATSGRGLNVECFKPNTLILLSMP